MSDEQSQANESPDQSLVDGNILGAAVEAAANKDPAEAPTLIEGEPLLSQYLRDGVFEILGKLAYAGAGPGIAQTVAEDMFRLLNVAANSLQSAYRTLLDDFLPDPSTPPSETTTQPTPEGSDQQGEPQ